MSTRERDLTEVFEFSERVLSDRRYSFNGKDILVLTTQAHPAFADDVIEYLEEEYSPDVVITYYENKGSIKSFNNDLDANSLAEHISRVCANENTISNNFITMGLDRYRNLNGDEREVRAQIRERIYSALNLY